jgi:hypothetical protein
MQLYLYFLQLLCIVKFINMIILNNTVLYQRTVLFNTHMFMQFG